MRAAVRVGLLVIAAWAAAGVLGAMVACSSGSSAPAAGVDASTPETGGGLDATKAETGVALDAGHEGSLLEGGCSPVKGACDLVTQDCPSGSWCGVEQQPDGSYVAACTPSQAVQHVAAGYACCPTAQEANDPCLPGLECVGDPCVGDAGGGRCTPHCCPGDDTPCGASPEGFTGHCDVGVVDNAGTPLYEACEYAPPCEPLGLVACPAGYACLVQDKTGDSKCSEIFNGGAAAATEGQACKYDNACAAGLMCLTETAPEGGTTSQCLMLCYTATGSPPFDAGALGMKPGTGGCNAGKACEGAPQIFPAWLGVCL
jgi:hypothetical protein